MQRLVKSNKCRCKGNHSLFNVFFGGGILKRETRTGTLLVLYRSLAKYPNIMAIQAALVICGLFICDFAYMRLKNGLFPRTYPPIYGIPRSFYMQIHYMRAYFWSPYLSHITRSACTCIQFPQNYIIISD
jgi:hypothetical protein